MAEETKVIDWERLHAKLPTDRTEEQKQARFALFGRFDPNGNGYLSLAEVDKGCRDVLELHEIFDVKPVMMRAFQAAKNASKAKNKANSLGEDYVEKREFRLLLVYLRKYFEIWQMFDRVDSSDDRRVDFEEFTKACDMLRQWGHDFDDAEAEFKKIDQNGGGKILFEEFSEFALAKCLDLEDDDEEPNEQPPQEQQPQEQGGAEASQGEHEEAQQHEQQQQEQQQQEQQQEQQQQEMVEPPATDQPITTISNERQQPQQQQQQAVVSGDVVGTFQGHEFTDADVDDIVKLQALYRKQHARTVVANVRAVKGEEQYAQQRSAAQAIEMPTAEEDDYCPAIPITHSTASPQVTAAAALSAAEGSSSAGQQGGRNNRGKQTLFSEVNMNALSVKEMSQDTQGMQTVYYRMLKSKTWW